MLDHGIPKIPLLHKQTTAEKILNLLNGIVLLQLWMLRLDLTHQRYPTMAMLSIKNCNSRGVTEIVLFESHFHG